MSSLSYVDRLYILLPSIYFLYSTEDKGDFFNYTLNVSGYQWGWEYNFNTVVDVLEPVEDSNYFYNYLNNVVDLRLTSFYDNDNNFVPYDFSNCLPRRFPYSLSVNISDPFLDLDNLSYAYKRLLEVKRLCLPANNLHRIQITSDDVLHSWALPSFGLKSDAVPGRINIVFTIPSKPGVYFGQCSELCGVGHGFMPISIRIDDFSSFLKWVWTQDDLTIKPIKIFDSKDLNSYIFDSLNLNFPSTRAIFLTNAFLWAPHLIYPSNNHNISFYHNIFAHFGPLHDYLYFDDPYNVLFFLHKLQRCEPGYLPNPLDTHDYVTDIIRLSDLIKFNKGMLPTIRRNFIEHLNCSEEELDKIMKNLFFI